MFRKQVNSSKWQGKTVGEFYPLTLADMDFPLYQPFKQKLVQSVTDLNNLTYKNRSQIYFSSIINWYNTHHLTNQKQGSHHLVNLQQQHFIECPSICNLVGCSIVAYTEERDNVLIFTPVYSFYINSVKSLKRKLICCELKQIPIKNNNQTESNIYQYQFDLMDFSEKMDQHKPKLLILCNPHNPSGKIFNRQQLDFIIKKAAQQQTYILSDEIMGDFTLYPSLTQETNEIDKSNIQKKFVSLVGYDYPRIIVGNSISKVFNCNSVQGGYGIIRDKQTRQIFNQVARKGFKFLTNQMGLIMTPIVYSKDGEEWIRMINKTINQNFSLLKQTFQSEKHLKIFELQSSYLTNIQFIFTSSQSIGNSLPNKYIAFLLEQYGIQFIDIQDYYYPKSTRNIFRISIALQNDQFKKFIVQFKNCLQYMKKSLANFVESTQMDQLRRSKL